MNGELLIIGGHEEKYNGEEILRKFMELAKRNKGPIGILPTASEIPDEVSADYINVFRKLNAEEIKVFNIHSRNEANEEDFSDTMSQISALFITGGDQSRLAEIIGKTKLYDAIFERWKNGMVIAGTSAGASIMGKSMIASAKTKESDKGLKIEMEDGFGFLDVLIDQHFSQRARFGRLLGAIAENQNLIGIGIDENTAILVENDKFKVYGEHQVFVIDGKEGNLVDLAISESGGEELTISNFKLHTLTNGFSFDLTTRQLIHRKED
ncbi:cyanophycinase [Bacillus methanolicus]|uniref:Cyanophycinase n=1 Tax=Bacillus methanolicus (strain MGA3 / ATCC 53907) TaxID=796606 RepID=I3E7Y1_BACMM|nr:cyanophycinase [Bacillus methanolicus]AIE59417.1 cyanophycinase [Bacillus methanolicus MGA3]EIJ82602.1 cyanophycinase [Bacillus methanolicus MGA3]UQD51489.1 cyanophycinase [Bacillus methanolicus]